MLLVYKLDKIKYCVCVENFVVVFVLSILKESFKFD